MCPAETKNRQTDLLLNRVIAGHSVRNAIHHARWDPFPPGMVFLIGFIHSTRRNTMTVIALYYAWGIAAACAGVALSG